MIVTIDGPAGSGKSTAAKGLSERLGFEYLDTGATYRAVTLAVLRAEINPEEDQELKKLLDTIQIRMPPGKVLLNGEDVTGLIRTSEVSQLASSLATKRIVREHLVQLQREIAKGRDMVCEGRDQGTVVFPDAACKFFLHADPVERAKRRQRQLESQGELVSLESLVAAQKERDQRDAQRNISPMVPAEDAVELDSTSLSLEEVIDQMAQTVQQRLTR